MSIHTHTHTLSVFISLSHTRPHACWLASMLRNSQRNRSFSDYLDVIEVHLKQALQGVSELESQHSTRTMEVERLQSLIVSNAKLLAKLKEERALARGRLDSRQKVLKETQEAAYKAQERGPKKQKTRDDPRRSPKTDDSLGSSFSFSSSTSASSSSHSSSFSSSSVSCIPSAPTSSESDSISAPSATHDSSDIRASVSTPVAQSCAVLAVDYSDSKSHEVAASADSPSEPVPSAIRFLPKIPTRKRKPAAMEEEEISRLSASIADLDQNSNNPKAERRSSVCFSHRRGCV